MQLEQLEKNSGLKSFSIATIVFMEAVRVYLLTMHAGVLLSLIYSHSSILSLQRHWQASLVFLVAESHHSEEHLKALIAAADGGNRKKFCVIDKEKMLLMVSCDCGYIVRRIQEATIL